MKEIGNQKSLQKRFQQYTLDKPNMKHLIRRILREDSPGTGTWSDPLITDDSGNVPIQSYAPTRVHEGEGKYVIKPVSKKVFFLAVELLLRMKDSRWFEENSGESLDDSPWYRAQDMNKTLKILGLNDTGIADKVFWAAIDNKEGVEDGSITNYDQLDLRAFRRYMYPMYESVRVFKHISWAPVVEAFDGDDARAEVIYDEDGVYQSGEWYDKEGYEEEEVDWESEGAESDGEIEEVGVVYPEETGAKDTLS